ncbi:TPA: replication protein [Legionella pneumophila]
MAVLRIHKKQQNFVILDKTCLNDTALSWGAKGLHAYLISLPDTWQVRVDDLKKRATNGRDAVRSLLKELEQAGYIQKSVLRNQENGRFGRLEYLVLETPEGLEGDTPPSPEKASMANPCPKAPAPEKPSSEIPAQDKPLLLNNKDNKYLIKQEITAAETPMPAHAVHESFSAAAAVFSLPEPRVQKSVAQSRNQKSMLSCLTENDATLGAQLTPKQQHRVQQLVDSLNVEEKGRLGEEIEYCLLQPQHFTACGQDFTKKLNAIRQVILRGAWQTPTGMLAPAPVPHDETQEHRTRLEEELRALHAEANHFKKMLENANEHARAHFEQFIGRAQAKIHRLQEELLGLGLAQAS